MSKEDLEKLKDDITGIQVKLKDLTEDELNQVFSADDSISNDLTIFQL